ncbi:MAG: GNAT family N-acetyltransferase [Deltaproteobacteria bacterium]|nr:GNAT family N-acetyltransferase [Deltaproteobacteria bacterium]
MSAIRIARTDAEIAACFAVMRELRTHLVAANFLDRVRQQEAGGYHLAYLGDEDTVRAVAGYRVLDNLFGGRILYVDDLVTAPTCRSKGYGKALLGWLVEHAKEQGCAFLELDSGVQRFDAHRFYLSNRMIISAHHFALKL